MTDDEIKLNGSSRQFLEEFYTMKSDLKNHLREDAKRTELMVSFFEKFDNFIANDYTPLKNKVEFHANVVKVLGGSLVIVFTAAVGWLFTHGG